MAKAKTGFNAASTKDKEAVGSSFKRLLSLIFLLSIATFAKMNADFQYLESWVSDAANGLFNAPLEGGLPEAAKRNLKEVTFQPISYKSSASLTEEEEEVAPTKTFKEMLSTLSSTWYKKFTGQTQNEVEEEVIEETVEVAIPETKSTDITLEDTIAKKSNLAEQYPMLSNYLG